MEAWRRFTKGRRVVVAIGELGAGKTTLGFNNRILILRHSIDMAGKREKGGEGKLIINLSIKA